MGCYVYRYSCVYYTILTEQTGVGHNNINTLQILQVNAITELTL